MNIARIVGAKTKGGALKLLKNRVYLGEAKSGDYVKPGAHPALVSKELFERVQRKLQERKRKDVAAIRRRGLVADGAHAQPAILAEAISPRRHMDDDAVRCAWRGITHTSPHFHAQRFSQ